MNTTHENENDDFWGEYDNFWGENDDFWGEYDEEEERGIDEYKDEKQSLIF